MVPRNRFPHKECAVLVTGVINGWVVRVEASLLTCSIILQEKKKKRHHVVDRQTNRRAGRIQRRTRYIYIYVFLPGT